MKVFHELEQLPKFQRGCYVAIGSFDGVHLGHQEIIRNMVIESQRENVESIVITFEPISKEFFSKTNHPIRITSAAQRRHQISQLGVDVLVECRFDGVLRGMSPSDFVIEILVRRLKTVKIFVGKDFRFGKGAAGDTDLLQRLGYHLGFECHVYSDIEYNRKRISSTQVRQWITNGQVELAARSLGRPYLMKLEVIQGEIVQRRPERVLVFDCFTSNCIPVNGRYLCRVSGQDISNSRSSFQSVVYTQMHSSRFLHVSLETIPDHIFLSIKLPSITLEFLQRFDPISNCLHTYYTEVEPDTEPELLALVGW